MNKNQSARIASLFAAFVAATAMVLGTALPSSAFTSVPPSGKPIPREFMGMHVLSVSSYLWPDVLTGTARMWDTGTSWRDIEPRKGRYQWASLDAAVSATKASGSQVLLVLGPTPAWAASAQNKKYDIKGPGSSSPPAKTSDFTKYVNAVTNRYKGRIEAYQIWNEANLLNFWRGTPAQMADLTQAAYKVIRKNDPNAKVVAASTTIRKADDYQKFFPKYLSELKKRKWPIDVLAVHAYPTGQEAPADRVRYLELAKQDIAAAGATQFPIWDTEVNYGLAGPGAVPKAVLSDATQQAYLAQTYLDSARLGIERTYWYAWAPPGDLLGVVTWPGSAAAKTFGVVGNWIVNGVYQGCTNQAPIVACDYSGLPHSGSGRVKFVWSQSGPAAYALPIGASSTQDVNGTWTPVSAGGVITVTQSPIMIVF